MKVLTVAEERNIETEEVAPPINRLKICLAASGGGHVRQLLDLAPVWSRHDHFFVTEKTALGDSLEAEHRTYFVPHIAAGQARLGSPFRLFLGTLQSIVRSARIIWRERPDVLISTGAGAVFFVLVWARLAGAKIIVIESFARFDGPSIFSRISAPWAHELIIQSEALKKFYPRAKVFDPLRLLSDTRPKKKPLLFATVGATLPFDRLVRSVAELKQAGEISEDVLIQTGVAGHAPAGLNAVETMPFDEVQSILTDADIVVCHGGTGSLITALRQGCRVIAMPRLARLGEHYDNHQAEITDAFAARGLISVANTTDELRLALIASRQRTPPMATTDPAALVAHLNELLSRARAAVRPRTGASRA